MAQYLDKMPFLYKVHRGLVIFAQKTWKIFGEDSGDLLRRHSGDIDITLGGKKDIPVPIDFNLVLEVIFFRWLVFSEYLLRINYIK